MVSTLTGIGGGVTWFRRLGPLRVLLGTRTLPRYRRFTREAANTLVFCRMQTVRFNYRAIFWTAAHVACVPER